ncbi:hypothetical protein I316_07153 [Kwoniella heveanensis BCC8398]|uniref:Uncharacterized protein n=1 Tax=Kwoniella heveanensis BCC8398 TaxID=1296120 RepID=A0A1B9GJS4_9TREE|nr:hypothetical protein I316_07153 [Kwoniella heveanensis BCC8398]
MPVKREFDTTDMDDQEDHCSADEKPTLDRPSTLSMPATPTKGPKTPKAKSNPITPMSSPKKPRNAPTTPSASAYANGNGHLSAKALYAIMIIETGIEKLSKTDVERATGLTANQQRDMTRKDQKGALRRALITAAEKL